MMKKHLLCFFVFILNANLSFCQNEKNEFKSKNKIVYDTLVIYDTLFITDTIRLLKNRQNFSALEKIPSLPIASDSKPNLSKNQDFLIISKNFAATFPKNSILLSDNNNNLFTTKNGSKMKKLNFFGVVLFAFQNMVMAQNAFKIGVGSGYHEVVTKRNVPQLTAGNSAYAGDHLTPPAEIFTFNTELEHFFHRGIWSISAGLNYTYLGKSNFSPLPITQFNVSSIDESPYQMRMNYIALPITLRMMIDRKERFKPSLGLIPYYKQTPIETKNITDPITGNVATEKHILGNFKGIAAAIGFDIVLYKNISLRLGYTKGLSVEKKSTFAPDGYLKSRMDKTEFSLFYTFKKKEKEE